MTRTMIDDSKSAEEFPLEGGMEPSANYGSSGPVKRNTTASHQVHALGGAGSAGFDWLDKAGPFAQVEF